MVSSSLDMLAVFPLKLLGRGIVVVAPIYHLVPWRPNPEPLRLRLPKFLVQRTAMILAMITFDILLTENSYIASMIHRLNPRVRVVLQSPGLPQDCIPTRLPPADLHDRDIDVLFLSAMKESKGVLDALRAWKRVSLGLPGRRMVVAGYADRLDESTVKEVIQRESLQDIEVFPNVGEAQKYQLLRRSKIVLVPSYMEGIPYVFYEAMAYGAVVVAYDLPTYPDVRNRIISTPVGDIDALANRVVEALRRYPDDWSRRGEDNFAFVHGHEFGTVMAEVAREVCEWVDGTPSRSKSPG